MQLLQAIAISLLLVGFYMMDSLLIKFYDKHRVKEGSGRSWNYTIMIMAGVTFIILQPFFLPWLSLPLPKGVLQTTFGLGIICVIIAFSLHLWARRHLRHFYTERVELQPNHRVINTGPYQYIRHPIFTSFFTIVIGIFLISPAVPTILMMLYCFYDFSHAAIAEEKLLSENLPEYTEYMQRTGRFLPHLR